MDRGLALLSLAAFAGAGMAPTEGAARAALTGGSLLVALLAWRRSDAGPIAGLLGGILLAGWLVPLWQGAMALGLGGLALLARRAPTLGWPAVDRARGGLPVGWTALCALVTPVALLSWLVFARPDLSDVVARYVPEAPLPLLLVGAALFALVNATLEELIWRGALQGRLEALFGPGWAVVLQAASFGLAHWQGVPRGPSGVVLAGAWAILLGLLRRRAGGLLAPVVAHVVADSVIAAIILTIARA